MRQRLVLDASAAVHILCGLPTARQLIEELADTAMVLAPELFLAEVGNALWKYVTTGALEREEAARLFLESRTLVDVQISHSDLADESFDAAIRHRHPVYDLLYAVLARRNAAPVMTMDRRFSTLLAEMGIESITPAQPDQP